MALTKTQRILLIVNRLASPGLPNHWKMLYTFLEQSGVNVGRTMLGSHYRQVSVLQGTAATRQAFLNRLKSLTKVDGVAAVDLFLQLHGSPGQLHFADGAVKTIDLRNDILALSLPKRLRLVYNTSCYGNSHSQHLIDAGFRSAIGSANINCNAGVEYPTFCGLWASGQTVQAAITAADNPTTRAIQDRIAKQLSPDFASANSRKTVRGLKTRRIST